MQKSWKSWKCFRRLRTGVKKFEVENCCWPKVMGGWVIESLTRVLIRHLLFFLKLIFFLFANIVPVVTIHIFDITFLEILLKSLLFMFRTFFCIFYQFGLFTGILAQLWLKKHLLKSTSKTLLHCKLNNVRKA
jgi:hypothetical protein